MSYKIVYDDLWNLSGITIQGNNELRKKLESLNRYFEIFILEDKLQGEMASSIKSYLQEVHGLLIQSINLLLTEYDAQLFLYKDGYFNIDSYNHSVLPEKIFENVKTELSNKQKEYIGNNDDLNNISKEISDLVSFNVRKGDDVNRYYSNILNNVDKLRVQVGCYESKHTKDLDSFKEHLNSFKKLVSYYVSQEKSVPTNYKSLDITKVNEIKDFIISYQSIQKHLDSSKKFLEDASEREKKRLELLKEEAIETRKKEANKKWFIGLLTATGGVIAIVATAGAATPLVATIGIIAGTGTTIYGTSNMDEARNSYNLAMKGDVTTKAFNPIRDTIFFESQKAYDITGSVMIFGTIFSGGVAQVSKLVSLGNGAIKSTAVVTTQFAGITGASYVGGQVFKEGTYYLSKNVFELTEAESQSNSRIAEIVGSVLTGITVAKPIVNFTNEKFSINNKIIDKDIKKTIEIKVEFKNEKLDSDEFIRQLAEQEKAMNKLTIKEYIDNRSAYLEKGRSNISGKLQSEIRKVAEIDKIEELLDKGYSIDQAKIKSKEWISTKHVLHNPDQIAGGNPTNVKMIGDAKVNQSIGGQWKSRIGYVDEMIDEFSKTIPPEDWDKIYLNIKLIP